MKKERNQSGLTLVVTIIIIVAIIVVASVTICYFMFNGKEKESGGNINSPNSNLSGTAVSELPEKILYKPNEDKEIYFNKNGEMIDLQSFKQNDWSELDFSYGTGVVENEQEQEAIINYKGEIIVDYNTYGNIQYTNYNYIARKYDSGINYILLNLNGSPVNNVMYDYLSQIDFEGLYLAKKEDTTQIITATGVVLCETKDNIELDNIEVWEGGREFIAIWVNNSDFYVVDRNKFECKCYFKSNNVGVGISYVTDIANNVTYIFDDQANLVFQLKDCLIKDDDTWETYRSVYEGVDINDYLDEYGYIKYTSNDNKIKIMYKDGTIITEQNYESLESKMGVDYIFIQNGRNVDVYNKNTKVTTIEDREISGNAISIAEIDTYAGIDVVPLIKYLEYTTSDIEIYLYDTKGNCLNDKAYSRKGNSTKLIVAEDGKAYRILANGELMDAKNYYSINLLVDEDSGNYSNQYFRGEVVNEENDKSQYYIIDRDGNVIFEIELYSYEKPTLYEELGLIIYRNTQGASTVYDLNAKKEILNSENELILNKEYKLIEETGYYRDVYSITGEKLYQHD